MEVSVFQWKCAETFSGNTAQRGEIRIRQTENNEKCSRRIRILRQCVRQEEKNMKTFAEKTMKIEP